jgi:hypothetical protein
MFFHSIFLAAALLLPLTSFISSSTQSPPPGGSTKKLLFIGNSYIQSNDLPQLVQALAQACGQPKPSVDAVLLGGVSLRDHWNIQSARRKIESGKWDYVILQQGPSSLPANAQELVDSTKEALPWIQKAGAQPALMMVWPEKTRLAAFPAVRQAYARAAQESAGVFLPAGRAWQLVLDRQPHAPLYSADQLHPTPEGSYLAALAIVAKLYQTSPSSAPANLRWSRYALRLKPELLQLFHDCVEAAIKEDPRP